MLHVNLIFEVVECDAILQTAGDQITAATVLCSGTSMFGVPWTSDLAFAEEQDILELCEKVRALLRMTAAVLLGGDQAVRVIVIVDELLLGPGEIIH